MFNKLKNKLSEEVKPFSLQTSVQQLTQAVTSSVLNASNDNANNTLSSSNTESEANANSLALQDDSEFTTIDLRSSTPVKTRRLSSSSTTSELFPIYESSFSKSGLQYDFESASEFDDTSSVQVEHVTKENLYKNYRKMQQKYNKYRGRYVDILKFYKELEHDNNKTKKLLSETQDKAIQRITELKEQCSLEQKAKAHLEETLRADLEERDHVISTLNDKIGWLKSSNSNYSSDEIRKDNVTKSQKTSETTPSLVDLSENSNNTNSDRILKDDHEINILKEKVKQFESLLSKAKEALTLKNRKIQELTTQLNVSERNYEENISSFKTKLETAEQTIVSLQGTVDEMKKREEESALSLAENKLSIHKELEEKESQIKILNKNILQIQKENDNLHRKIQELDTMNQNRQQSADKMDISPPVVQNSLLRLDEESKFLSDDMKLRIANIKIDFLKYLNIKDLNNFKQYDSNETTLSTSNDTANNSTVDIKDDNNHSVVNDALNNLRSELQKTPISKEDSEKYLTELEKCIKIISATAVADEAKLKTTVQQLSDEMSKLRIRTIRDDNWLADSESQTLVNDSGAEDRGKFTEEEKRWMEEEIRDCKETIRKLETSLSKKCKEYNGVKSDSELRCSKAESELEDYKNRLGRLEHSAELERKTIVEQTELFVSKRYEDKLAEVDGMLSKKEADIRSCREEKNKLTAEIESIRTRLQITDDERREQIDNLRRLLEKSEERITEIGKDLDERTKRSVDVENERDKLGREIQNVRAELEAVGRAAEVERAEAKINFFEVDRLNNEYREQITEMNRTIAEKDSCLTENYRERDKLLKDIARLTSELENEIMLKQNFRTETNDEIDRLRESLNDRKLQISELAESMQNRAIEYDETRCKLLTEIESLKCELKNRNVRNEQLTADSNNLERTIESLLFENANIKTEIESERQANSVLTNDYESFRFKCGISNSNYLNAIKRLKTDNNVLRTNCQHALKDLFESTRILNDRFKILTSSGGGMFDNRDDSTGDVIKIDYEKQIRELNDEIDRLQRQNDERLLENNEINDKLREQVKQLSSESIERYEQLQSERARSCHLDNALRLHRSLYDRATIEASVIIASLKAELDEIRIGCTNELTTLEHRLRQKTDQYQRLEDAVRRLNQNVRNVRLNQHATVNSCKRDVITLFEYTRNYRTELDACLDKINGHKTAATRMENLNVDISELERKTKILNNENDSLKNDKKELLLKINDLSNLINKYESDAEIVSRKNDLSVSNLDNEKLKDAHNRQLQQVVYNFECELAKKNEEYERLKNEKLDKNEELENEVYRELNRIINSNQDDFRLKNDAFEKLIEEFDEYKRKTELEKEEIKSDYINQLQETDKKWRHFLDQKLAEVETQNKEEITELSKEWTTERKQLENTIGSSTCDVTTTIESLEKRISTLSQELYETKKIHKKEINDLQRLLKIPKENQILDNEVSLEDCTELEYLRNVLYEYMMGKEPAVLAKVIAAIVKFDADQTKKIVENEEQKLSLLGHFTSNIGF